MAAPQKLKLGLTKDKVKILESYMSAAQEGNLELLRHHLETNPSFLNVSVRDENGISALHWSVTKGHTDVITYLLENGAFINTKDIWGNTPLHKACVFEQVNALKILVGKGADTTIENLEGKIPEEVGTGVMRDMLRARTRKSTDALSPADDSEASSSNSKPKSPEPSSPARAIRIDSRRTVEGSAVPMRIAAPPSASDVARKSRSRNSSVSAASGDPGVGMLSRPSSVLSDGSSSSRNQTPDVETVALYAANLNGGGSGGSSGAGSRVMSGDSTAIAPPPNLLDLLIGGPTLPVVQQQQPPPSQSSFNGYGGSGASGSGGGGVSADALFARLTPLSAVPAHFGGLDPVSSPMGYHAPQLGGGSGGTGMAYSSSGSSTPVAYAMGGGGGGGAGGGGVGVPLGYAASGPGTPVGGFGTPMGGAGGGGASFNNSSNGGGLNSFIMLNTSGGGGGPGSGTVSAGALVDGGFGAFGGSQSMTMGNGSAQAQGPPPPSFQPSSFQANFDQGGGGGAPKRVVTQDDFFSALGK